jgi:hypothetical protein
LREVRSLGPALFHEDEHHAPGVDEPSGAHPRDAGDPADHEAHPLALEFGAGGVEVLADQADVGETVIGQGPLGVDGAVDVEVLDHLEHPVAAVLEADDGRLHGGVGHQLTHVVANGITAHDVRRREHTQAQYVSVERHRRLAVGHAHPGVGQPGNHVLNLTSASRFLGLG